MRLGGGDLNRRIEILWAGKSYLRAACGTGGRCSFDCSLDLETNNRFSSGLDAVGSIGASGSTGFGGTYGLQMGTGGRLRGMVGGRSAGMRAGVILTSRSS